MRHVGGIVDKRAQMNARALRQMLEQVPRADLVPLVGRIWDAVREEEDIAHRRVA